MKRTLRFLLRLLLRLLLTPVVALSFGVIYILFVCMLGPLFTVVSFAMSETFSWAAWFELCNDFYTEPLRAMWGLGKNRW